MEFIKGAPYVIGDRHAYQRCYMHIVGKTLLYVEKVVQYNTEYHMVEDRNGLRWGVQECDILPLPVSTNAEATTLLRGDY